MRGKPSPPTTPSTSRPGCPPPPPTLTHVTARPVFLSDTMMYGPVQIPGQLNRARGKRDWGAGEHSPEDRGGKRARVDRPVHRPPQTGEQGLAARLLPMQQSGASEKGDLRGGESGPGEGESDGGRTDNETGGRGRREGGWGWMAEEGQRSDCGSLSVLNPSQIRREGQEREGQREGRGGETPPSDCSLTGNDSS